MRLLLSALILAGLSAPAIAQSSNDMIPACKSYINKQLPKDNFAVWKQGTCIGMIQALMFTGHDFARAPICPPVGATAEQGVRVVVAAIEKDPASMHMNFAVDAAIHLHFAWPCKAKPTR
jgi:hypothetical protein